MVCCGCEYSSTLFIWLMKEYNRAENLEKAGLDRRIWLTTPDLGKNKESKIVFSTCCLRLPKTWFCCRDHAESWIALNVTGWNAFGQVTIAQASHAISPPRNVSSTSNGTMKPVPCFIHTHGQICGSSAVSVFENLGKIWSYCHYVNFPRIMLNGVSRGLSHGRQSLAEAGLVVSVEGPTRPNSEKG